MQSTEWYDRIVDEVTVRRLILLGGFACDKSHRDIKVAS
jgi:hypothetical protein